VGVQESVSRVGVAHGCPRRRPELEVSVRRYECPKPGAPPGVSNARVGTRGCPRLAPTTRVRRGDANCFGTHGCPRIPPPSRNWRRDTWVSKNSPVGVQDSARIPVGVQDSATPRPRLRDAAAAPTTRLPAARSTTRARLAVQRSRLHGSSRQSPVLREQLRRAGSTRGVICSPRRSHELGLPSGPSIRIRRR